MIVERLDPRYHDRETFDSGEPALNQFLRAYARQFHERGLGVTWVATVAEDAQRVAGFYTLSMSAVLPAELDNPRLRVPRILVVLLGRLAIDRQFQGQRMGEQLLMHALYTAYRLSRHIGAYAVVVDPLDTRAADFYRKYDFQPMPGTPERLFLSMKHLATILGPLALDVPEHPPTPRIPTGE